MDYAANNYEAPFKRFLGYSAWLHIGLIAAVALSVWIQRAGNPWGGPGGGGDSSVKVNLISSAGIPMPHPVVPTPSQVVDPTKGLAQEEPKIESPKDATPILKFKEKQPPPPPSKKSKVFEPKIRPPDNATPYGKGGGQLDVPTGYSQPPGASASGLAVQGQGGGDAPPGVLPPPPRSPSIATAPSKTFASIPPAAIVPWTTPPLAPSSASTSSPPSPPTTPAPTSTSPSTSTSAHPTKTHYCPKPLFSATSVFHLCALCVKSFLFSRSICPKLFLSAKNSREAILPNKNRASLILSVLTLSLLSLPAAAQDWFRTGTGLGVDKPRIAVADFAPRADNAKPHAALFTQTVRDDLSFSGVIELVSPSFYPAQVPSAPQELQKLTWTDPPLTATSVAFAHPNKPPP